MNDISLINFANICYYSAKSMQDLAAPKSDCVNYQLSTINYQLSIINYQLSTIN